MFCLKGQGKQIVIKENLSWIFLSVFVVFTLYLVVELQNMKMSVFKIVLYFNANCYISFIRLIKLFVPPPICLHAKPNFNLFIYIPILLLEMLCYRHWLLIYIGCFSVTLWLNRILMINLQIFVFRYWWMVAYLSEHTRLIMFVFVKNIKSVAIRVLTFHKIFRWVRGKKRLGKFSR